MNCAGAEAERNTKNAIFWRIKKRRTGAHQVAEKPEALNKLSSAYPIFGNKI